MFPRHKSNLLLLWHFLSLINYVPIHIKCIVLSYFKHVVILPLKYSFFVGIVWKNFLWVKPWFKNKKCIGRKHNLYHSLKYSKRLGLWLVSILMGQSRFYIICPTSFVAFRAVKRLILVKFQKYFRKKIISIIIILIKRLCVGIISVVTILLTKNRFRTET